MNIGWRQLAAEGQLTFASPFSMENIDKPSFTEIVGSYLDSFTTDSGCFKFGPTSSEDQKLKSTSCFESLDFKYHPVTSPNPDKQLMVLCQFTECQTIDSKVCKFPFRFKGRLYDTCITIDSEYPWCSLSTDTDNNHIGGEENKGQCSVSCYVQNCPVGFFFQNGNCFYMSARTWHDRVDSIHNATQVCSEKGSRLYQPKDLVSFGNLTKIDEEFLGDGKHFQFKVDKTFIAIGAFFSQYNNKLIISYSDGSRAYPIERKIIEQGDELSSELENGCIVLNEEAKFSFMKCEDFKWLDGSSAVGYVCEARTKITKDGPDKVKSCHFPFKVEGQDEWKSSCVKNSTFGISWCATEVDIEGYHLQDKWGLCEDERQIAYDGDGSGKMCIHPFLHKRIWYDKCYPDNEDDVEEGKELWCPTVLNPTRLYNDDIDEKGYCTEYMKPATGDCDVNYELVNENCIRVSAFAETFSDAAKMCEGEGAYLLSLPNAKVLPPILDHIDLLNETKTYFMALDSPKFWMGASATDFIWRWTSNGKNTSLYSNWAEEDKGCASGLCTNNYALTIDKSKNYAWIASDKGSRHPYICESKCLGGYKWFPKVNKCIKKIDVDEGERFSDALFACSSINARLLDLRNCDQIDMLEYDLYKMNKAPPEGEYWIGLFSGGFDHYMPTRITNSKKTEVKSISSTGLIGVNNCPTLEVVDLTQNAFKGFLKFDLQNNVQLEFLRIKDQEDGGEGAKKGYMCEHEESWGCPTDFFLFQEECYGFESNQSSFTEALMNCNSIGAHLIQPSTELHETFIKTILQKLGVNSPVWTGYRKNMFHDIPDTFHTTSDYSKSEVIPVNITGTNAILILYKVKNTLFILMKIIT